MMLTKSYPDLPIIKNANPEIPAQTSRRQKSGIWIKNLTLDQHESAGILRNRAQLNNFFAESLFANRLRLWFQIEGSDSFWTWSKINLVPGLFDTNWYNNERFDHPEGFISNKQQFLVGMPRFRQVRVKTGSYPRCSATESVDN